MATSREVYNRIRWDPRFDPRRFVVGYRDNTSERPLEMPFEAWDGTVPWHRVSHFALDGRIVWSRDGVDLLSSVVEAATSARAATGGFDPLPVHRFVGGAWVVVTTEGPSLPSPLRVVTWNVLSERHDPEPERADERRTLALVTLRELDADVIALQEVTRPFLARLLAEPWVQTSYAVTDAAGETLKPEGPLLLARRPFTARSHLFGNGKRAIVGRFAGRPRPVVVAAIHLTSDQARDAAKKRAHELATISAHLTALKDEADVVLAGDLNTRDEDPGGLVRAGFTDAWRALHPADPGWTFLPARNPLAARTSWRGLPARFDRLLLLARDLEPTRAACFGNAHGIASDHEGLALDLEAPGALDVAPDVHTALAILPPERFRPAIDALRRLHDPAFPRWPPHVNLLYPFVPPDRVDEAVEVASRALAGARTFSLSLAHFDVFEHASSATVIVRPTGDLSALHAALAARFPGLAARDELVPHLTLAKCRTRHEAVTLAATFAQDWTAPVFDVRELAVLVRGADGPFAVHARVPLGGAFERWLVRADARDPASRREAVVQRVRDALPAAQVHVAGSTRLGVADVHGDLDLLVVAPGADLARLGEDLAARLGVLVRVVANARAPVLRLALDGLPVDVQVADAPTPDLAALDALRATAVERVGAERFESVVLALRTWARARRVLGQAWGFPGGLAWTRLAVAGVEGASAELSPERLLLRVLERGEGLDLAATLTRDTREVVADELARAVTIARRVVAGGASWDELVAPPDPLHERDHALVLAADGPDEAARERGRGVLEREALGLILDLERAPAVRAVRPYPPRRGEPGVIGLHLADRGPVDALTGGLAATLGREGATLRVWLDTRGEAIA